MTDVLPPAGGDRVEPVGLEVEMQRSYLDYAMCVIVGRALPDVRDGLKPVHRKILYAMFDSGFRPDRGYVKCARVVGDVMGNYHPHGDTAIYDALVRMAQPWSLRYPLIDGNGNFGSPGNDPAAAMRYCVTGDTLVRTPHGTVRIGDIVPDAAPDSDTDIDLKVIDRNGDPVRASKLFHSGDAPDAAAAHPRGLRADRHRATTRCSAWSASLGVPTLLWKLLEEIRPGDRVVLQRVPADEIGTPPLHEVRGRVPGRRVRQRGLRPRAPGRLQQHRPGVLRVGAGGLRRGRRRPALRLVQGDRLRQPAARAGRPEHDRAAGRASSATWSGCAVPTSGSRTSSGAARRR